MTDCGLTMGLGTAGMLCCWALQEYSAVAVGHCRNVLRSGTAECRDTLRLGTAGIPGGWALQGYSAVGHCRDTCSWALQGYFVVGYRRDAWWSGTAGMLRDGRCSQAPGGGRGQHRLSNLTTPLRGWRTNGDFQACRNLAACYDIFRDTRTLSLSVSLSLSLSLSVFLPLSIYIYISLSLSLPLFPAPYH